MHAPRRAPRGTCPRHPRCAYISRAAAPRPRRRLRMRAARVSGAPRPQVAAPLRGRARVRHLLHGMHNVRPGRKPQRHARRTARREAHQTCRLGDARGDEAVQIGRHVESALAARQARRPRPGKRGGQVGARGMPCVQRATRDTERMVRGLSREGFEKTPVLIVDCNKDRCFSGGNSKTPVLVVDCNKDRCFSGGIRWTVGGWLLRYRGVLSCCARPARWQRPLVLRLAVS
jgi:hypothetical protein